MHSNQFPDNMTFMSALEWSNVVLHSAIKCLWPKHSSVIIRWWVLPRCEQPGSRPDVCFKAVIWSSWSDIEAWDLVSPGNRWETTRMKIGTAKVAPQIYVNSTFIFVRLQTNLIFSWIHHVHTSNQNQILFILLISTRPLGVKWLIFRLNLDLVSLFWK